MPPKVLHLSTYDLQGGAGRAAFSLHQALRAHGWESRMTVARKQSTESTVQGCSTRHFTATRFADRSLWRLQSSPTKTWRSPARFSAISASQINSSKADIVNLHWVTDGFLSIEEIGRIEKPILWSMYDMWPYSGTEHYVPITSSSRWMHWYSRESRPKSERGFDIDRWTFLRKTRHWERLIDQVLLLPASAWLAATAQQSSLMRDWRNHRTPHVVDTDNFAPMSLEASRQLLGLEPDSPTIGFLASGGVTDMRKGWDLLHRSLPIVADSLPDARVLVVGPMPHLEARTEIENSSPLPIDWLGEISSSRELSLVYNALSALAVPSREDNLPLTALEAQSCGCPVVAFDVGGLSEIVIPLRTGGLVPPFDSNRFGEELVKAVKERDEYSLHARAEAVRRYSRQAVVATYNDALAALLS